MLVCIISAGCTGADSSRAGSTGAVDSGARRTGAGHMWPEGKSIETKIIKQGTTWNHSEMLGYFQKV